MRNRVGCWFAALVAALAGVSSAAHAAAVDQEVSIDGGRAPLYGSLLPGGGKARKPAVLIISGSGPTDRDSNSTFGLKPNSLKMLAQTFASAHITSLRYDKRGVGKSAPAAPPQSEMRFDVMVQDAVAWAKYLAKQDGVSCIVFAGHSEGSLIAALAAHVLETEQVPVCGVISIAGAGRPASIILADQLRAALPEPLRSKSIEIIGELEHGRLVANVPDALVTVFRPDVQPYMISWFAYDPVAAYRGLKVPVMVLQGDADLQVSVADAQALGKAKPGIDLVIVKRVNHVLKHVTLDREANMATYNNPVLPLDKGVTAAVLRFLGKVGG
jgi:pimeloyl-ACP methyl ester carboxylesterase